ncbi:MAG: glycoside hydrolase family 3 N-terminal domain-containing protein [Candidatus Staskawiczbacteria bacterium]|jgi:beta-N-acetylhexosaminidase
MKKLLISFIIIGLLGILIVALFLYANPTKGIDPIDTREPQDVRLTDEQLKEEIGQMIMIGFRGTEAAEDSEISKIIKEVKIGGVVLFDLDVPSNSFPRNIVNYQQTKGLIASIQKYSVTPLFVAVDAEGGSVNRLKAKYGFLPIVSAEKMGEDKTLQTVYRESTELAGELKGLGFNMNLAPVVDVNINPESPAIGALGRSFSSDPEEVINQARIFIQNHLEDNIITVEKHFPGHGSAAGDSHKGFTDVTNTYRAEELIPFQTLNEEGLLKAVMTAHITNANIDKDYPATLSKYFLQDILRGQIGFDGVIISDDMQMAAISNNYPLDEAIILSINAGVDVISVLNNSSSGYDGEMAYKVRDIIFNAVKGGKITEARIGESYNRILDLKNEFKIIQSAKDISQKIAEIYSRKFELIGEPQTLTFGRALETAKWVEEIAVIRPAFLLSIFQEELKLEKFDLCYLTNFKTGEGVRASDGKKLAKVMKPDRDIHDFLDITKELGKDPSKTLVTCPMSFGWGGAMGPADFIPSTWMRYKDKIEKITGKAADPWNIPDAFLAAGLYLSDSGAKAKTHEGEWNAAMIYFSGSPNAPYTWYADGAMAIAEEIQGDIEMTKGY